MGQGKARGDFKMKKYILNLNGQIEELIDENERLITVRRHNFQYKMKKSWAVKQANTIEELIDEYILREKANCKLDVNYDELNEDDVKLCLQDHDIFGAIWVNGDKEEPILKSVAKMNEKGDLELL